MVDLDKAVDRALEQVTPLLRPPLVHARHLYLTSSYADESRPAGCWSRCPPW